MNMPRRVQCTAVAISGRGVVLTGAPGAGKSDLALRLISEGATLIGDDVVEVAVINGRLAGSPVAGAAGRMMIAGIGPVSTGTDSSPVPLALCVLLDPARLRGDRLPALDAWEAVAGHWLPRIALDTGPAAPDKVRLALRLWGH